MAGADRMAIEEVVRMVLVDKHADVLRAAQERMKAVCGSNAEGDVAKACQGFLAS